MPRPRFEPVSECSICGLDFYESEMVRHYKTNRLVDRACDDQPGASDYLEKMKRPVEHQKRAKQPVPRDENGYEAAEWATVSVLSGVSTAQVVGDNRAGILTVKAGEANEVMSFSITYGTPLLNNPTNVIATGWGPNGEATPIQGLAFDTTGLTGLIPVKANVVYQYRYEVRR